MAGMRPPRGSARAERPADAAATEHDVSRRCKHGGLAAVRAIAVATRGTTAAQSFNRQKTSKS